MYVEPRCFVIALQTSWIIFDAVENSVPNTLAVISIDPVSFKKYKGMANFLFAGSIIGLGDKIFGLI